MRVLRKGRKGEDVGDWQAFLRGLGFHGVLVTNLFDDATVNATKAFQKNNKLGVDGVVGPISYGKAFMLGFQAVEDDDKSETGPNWPSKPKFKPLSYSVRPSVLGVIKCVPTGGGAIKITNNWTANNLTKIEVPLLKGRGIKSFPKSGKIFFHTKGVDQFLGLIEAWDKEGLLDRILTWGGSWAPRYVRGSKTYLSNHSWASAFDINVAWNGLKRQPALVGKKGSVRELVPLANKYGFYWGGHFKRPDGMHFELAQVGKKVK